MVTGKGNVAGPFPKALVAYTEHWKVTPGVNVSMVNCSSVVTADVVSVAVQLSVYDRMSPFCSIGSGGDHLKAIAVASTSTSKFNGGPVGAEKKEYVSEYLYN